MSSKELILPDMTKAEAIASEKIIDACFETGGAELKNFHDRRGWAAFGFKSWEAYALQKYGLKRARVFQLLDEAKIAEEIDDKAQSGRTLRALKGAPKGQRKKALAQAQEEHATETPTEKQVSETVKKNWGKSGVKKSKPKPKSISEQAVDDDDLKKALGILGGTCNRGFRKAIEEGTVEMTRNDVVKLAEQDDETMIQAEKLLSVNRWKLSRCLSFLSKMPTERDRIETILWLAMSAPNGLWEGEFGAQRVTVAPIKKR